jgi:hypothetical protein
MCRPVKVLVLIVLAALVVAGGWWALGRFHVTAPAPAPRESRPLAVLRPPAPSATDPSEAKARLQASAEALQRPGGSQNVHRLLDDLRRSLTAMPPEEASAVIREFLDTKVDAASGSDFKISPDGSLAESPTLRVFLLDCLAQVDPAGAAAYAREILKELNSADEWAVALRSCARGTATPEGNAFLEEKMRALLRHEPWQANPSVGYLEAFDVAVHLGGTALMPELTKLVRGKDNQAVAHAAYLALDRLTINHPTSTLQALLDQPQLMQGREVTRANYFARADLSDPAQRGLLEYYLLQFNPGIQELETFTGLFPNANYMVSHNLLTPTQTPDGATLARRDRAALQTVQEWLADPRFEGLRPQLERIRKRLETFVAPAREAEPAR